VVRPEDQAARHRRLDGEPARRHVAVPLEQRRRDREGGGAEGGLGAPAMRHRARRLAITEARPDDISELHVPLRVAEVAAAPALQDRGDVRERPPLEHGHVLGDARRAQARHRRVGSAPGVVEPAPALLAERPGGGDTTGISTATRRPSRFAVFTVTNSPGLSSVAGSGVCLKPPGHCPGAASAERATSSIFVSGVSSITSLLGRLLGVHGPNSSSVTALASRPVATIIPECLISAGVVSAAWPAPGTSRPASSSAITTCFIGVLPGRAFSAARRQRVLDPVFSTWRWFRTPRRYKGRRRCDARTTGRARQA